MWRSLSLHMNATWRLYGAHLAAKNSIRKSKKNPPSQPITRFRKHLKLPPLQTHSRARLASARPPRCRAQRAAGEARRSPAPRRAVSMRTGCTRAGIHFCKSHTRRTADSALVRFPEFIRPLAPSGLGLWPAAGPKPMIRFENRRTTRGSAWRPDSSHRPRRAWDYA